MTSNDFTSGPVRDLTPEELGTSEFSDFELISDSGHNLIYRAICGGKWVVLKAARIEEGNTTRNQLLLRREYDIMRSIDSIYVVHPWQMMDVPAIGMAIVMEYIQGRTLDAFLQQKPSISERRRVMEELMEALISIHERQIIHGDLKVTNVLITITGNHVRLIDFGFADNDAYIAKNIGSTPSIAPTQLSTADTADVQRDIYALGKILSELFPHRFQVIRKRCCHAYYPSVQSARQALNRYQLFSWLIPVICAAIVIIAAIIGWSRSVSPDTPSTHQIDTVVMEKPVVVLQIDSTWLHLKEQAEKQYNALYRLYADSLRNMAEPDRAEAIAMHNRYASEMLHRRDRLIAAHPEYEEQLIDQQLTIYARDYSCLAEIYQDYPIIIKR